MVACLLFVAVGWCLVLFVVCLLCVVCRWLLLFGVCLLVVLCADVIVVCCCRFVGCAFVRLFVCFAVV